MTLKITSTTDGRYVGQMLFFTLEDQEVIMYDGGKVAVDRIVKNTDGTFTLSGSNYIITTEKE